MNASKNRIALITGAGRGIGRCIAGKLADSGATVIVTDLDGDSAIETAAELGQAHRGYALDVADQTAAAALTESLVTELGRIDILVNNAGWDKLEPFVDSQPDTWHKVVNINLFGVINLSHAVVPHMIANGYGRVINIASDAGRVGSSGEAVYSAAKGGVIAFTKTLAREVARYPITANAVCPGPTDTHLLQDVAQGNEKLISSLECAIPKRRLGRPADIAHAVAFFAADDSEFITGQTLSVSGGLTMV